MFQEEKQWLFVSDVDDTLLGDDQALSQLGQALRSGSAHLTLVYNSSRPCASLRQTLATNPALPLPDYLAGAMGTEIEKGPSGEALADYARFLDQGWDRRRIDLLAGQFGLEPHPREYQTPFKASYDIPNQAIFETFQQDLAATGLQAKAIVSGVKNLDVIPARAGKGQVIQYLQRWLQIPPGQVVVAGDSGNDLEMFVEPYRGIVVANADPELKGRSGPFIYHAQGAYAAGVLEGLRHWQVVA